MNDNHIAVAFKLHLDRMKVELKDAERDFKQFSKRSGDHVDKLDRKSKKLTGSIAKWGASLLATYVGLHLLTTGINGAVTAGSSFEATMYKVKAISGATQQEWMALENQALQLGSTTRFSATEVGHLQVEYSKLGFVPDMIRDMTEGTLNLAAATGEGLGEVSMVVGGVLNAYNLEASETVRVTDVMAKLFSSSAEDLQKFKVAIGHAGTTSARYGLKIEDTSALLGVLVDRNIRAETTGTGVRNMLSMMNEEGHKLNVTLGGGVKNFDELIDRLITARDDEEKMKDSLKAVGRENENVFSTLVMNIDALLELRRKLDQAEGSGARMAKTMEDNLKGATTELKSATEGLGIAFFKTFNENLTEGAKKVAGFVRGLTEWIRVPMADQLEEERIKLNGLVSAIVTTNTNQKLRNDLLQELQDKYPDFLKNLDTETTSNEELAQRLADVNEEMIKNIVIKRREDELTPIREKEATALESLIKKKIEFGKTIAKYEQKYDIEIDKSKDMVSQYKEMSIALREYLTAEGFYAGTIDFIQMKFAESFMAIQRAQGNLTNAAEETKLKHEEILAIKKELGILTDIEAANYLSMEELMARMTAEQRAQAEEMLNNNQLLIGPVDLSQQEKAVRDYYITIIQEREKAKQEDGGSVASGLDTDALNEFTVITDYLNSVQKAGYEQALSYNKEKMDAVKAEIDSGVHQGKELEKLERIHMQLALKNLQLNDQWISEKDRSESKIAAIGDSALARRLNNLKTEEQTMLEMLESLGLATEQYESERLRIQQYYAEERIRVQAEARQKEIDGQETKKQREYELDIIRGDEYIQWLNQKDEYYKQMLADGLITEEKYNGLKQEMENQSLNVAMKRYGLLKQGYKAFLKGEAKDYITAQQIKLFGKLAEIMATGGATLGTSLLVSLPLYGAGIAALELAKGKIDQLYTGTRNYKGGLAMTGERGMELMNLPQGTDVYNHQETRSILNNLLTNKGSQPEGVNTTQIVQRIKTEIDMEGVEKRLDGLDKTIRETAISAAEIAGSIYLNDRGRMS